MLFAALLAARAATAADVVSYGPMVPGCGYPEGPPCYHDGVPSVDCRRTVATCASTQMKTVALRIVTASGCLLYRWEWNCTANALEQCVGELWCDPRAACNATAGSCACPGESVVIDDDGGCGCNGTDVHLNGTHCRNNTACAVELAPPTPTTDRVCQNATTADDDDPGPALYEPGQPVFWALVVIGAILLCACGCCLHNRARRGFRVSPA